MGTPRQQATARGNIRKAAAAAKRKRTIAHLAKRVRTALGKQTVTHGVSHGHVKIGLAGDSGKGTESVKRVSRNDCFKWETLRPER